VQQSDRRPVACSNHCNAVHVSYVLCTLHIGAEARRALCGMQALLCHQMSRSTWMTEAPAPHTPRASPRSPWLKKQPLLFFRTGTARHPPVVLGPMLYYPTVVRSLFVSFQSHLLHIGYVHVDAWCEQRDSNMHAYLKSWHVCELTMRSCNAHLTDRLLRFIPCKNAANWQDAGDDATACEHLLSMLAALTGPCTPWAMQRQLLASFRAMASTSESAEEHETVPMPSSVCCCCWLCL